MQETQEMWVGSLGQEDPLEKEMATCSSILARKISWTEEPDGLQSMELQSDMTEHAHVVGTEDLKQKRNMAHAAVLQQLLQCCAFLS